MASRLDLQKDLETILGSKNVYYQPPESKTINYPAIIYKLSGMTNHYAEDIPYIRYKEYELILIHANPDNSVVDRLSKQSLCRFVRHYKSNNLNHYVFTIYY